MYIKKISISDFGMFSALDIDFENGINIVHGDNEKGKSTISEFIKFIFYGADEKEKQKYIGWGKNQAFGTLTLNYGGKDYRIERELICTTTKSGSVAYKEYYDIIDVSTNIPAHKGEQPYELFLGVPKNVYESTVSSGQFATAQLKTEGLGEAIENILFSADEKVNTKKALKKLDDARVSLLYKNKKGGFIYDSANEIAELEARLAKAQESNKEIFRIHGTIRDVENKIASNKEKTQNLQDKLREYVAYARLRKYENHKALKKKIEELQEKLAQLKENSMLSDISGSDKFFEDMAKLNADILYTEEKISDLKKNIEDMSNDADAEQKRKSSENIKKAVDEYGSSDDVLSIIHKAAGYKRSLIITVVLAIVAACALAGAVVSYAVMSNIASTLVCGGAFAVFTIIAIVLYVGARAKKENAAYVFDTFGCSNEDELLEMFEQLENSEKYFESVNSKISEKNDELVQLGGHKVQKKTELANLISSFCGGSFNESTENIDDKIEKIKSVIAAIRALEADIEKHGMLYDSQKDEIAAIDVEAEKNNIKGLFTAEEIKDFNVAQKEREREFLIKQTESLNEKLTELKSTYSVLCGTSENPTTIFGKLCELKAKNKTAVKQYGALMLAEKALGDASISLKNSISPRISEDASALVAVATDSKYKLLGVDEMLNMTYDAESVTRSVAQMSGGTRDVAYVCLRIALMNLLYRKETPFLCFDDSFVYMDDKRLKNMVNLLSFLNQKGKIQSIIFTCHNRESEMAKNANLIKLN